MSPATAGSSTRPYLIRALHDWCTDNGYTPYIAVQVGTHVQVPMEYVKNGEIVLNIGFEATTGLKLGNEAIEFKARFGGTSRELYVPVDHVIAIYARENGQGMAFPAPDAAAATSEPTAPHPAPRPTNGLRLASDESGTTPSAGAEPDDEPPAPEPPTPLGPRPALKRIK